MTALAIAPSAAQVASHAPTSVAKQPASQPAAKSPSAAASQQVVPVVNDKPVAKVNGTVLTERDLVREMFIIFPYAKQHNGFPKSQEAEIRAGALQMIIFEELVYQDAVRRGMTVSPEKINRAEAEFKKQFSSPAEYQAYLKSEMGGSSQKVRELIKRSMLIDQYLKTDVENRSKVTMAEARAYYDKNPGKFEQGESFTFQTISILPPRNGTAAQIAEGKKRAQEALKQAKATNSYEQFGLLAEKISEDDYRVNMGDRKTVERDKLPPQVVKAMQAMKPGQVSDLIEIEGAYAIVRLNAHAPAGKVSFDTVEVKLQEDLQKQKYEQLRSNLDKKLRSTAKVEIVNS